MAEHKKIKITQTRSIVDQLENAKRTIKALGLGRPNYFVVKNDTPQIRGMINAVRHMVKVEEVHE
ncbi:MAG TPA: 50S ribosomal protein L30 [Bacteroidota bacterium]|nr:50S ribosomal protein L30 [Bacteroidota bacterium]